MFKITPKDLGQVVALALGGSVLFGGFALGKLYTEKKVILKTCFQGKQHLLKHDRVMSVCSRLSDQISEKHASYITFLRVLKAVDEFLQFFDETRNKLQQKDIMEPFDKQGTRDHALSLQVVVTQNIKNLGDSFCTHTSSTADIARVLADTKELDRIFDEYIQVIWNWTQS